MSKGQRITPRAEDFSKWYNDVVARAELAEHSPVRGLMVIRPRGYRIWELMQRALDDMFRETGHENAYFPLLIPQSFLAKEAEHVKGFAPELAVVTHAGGKELDEPLVIRPTSETIIYDSFSRWIQSYRDLPLLINQWANVVRWELRPRLFLRTSEFLWQEGHTAHATEAEAEAEALLIMGLYRRFMEDWAAVPVITGLKTDSERFAGALRTYAMEALMQDNKALQAGTSHNLGQNFAKAFNVQYQTQDGALEYVWNTSWGVSTRLIGGLIMVHGDDSGLVLPPRLAPDQVVVVPIWRSDDERTAVLQVSERVRQVLCESGVRVRVDDREDMKPGAKYYEWECRGVPVRLEIGPRDVSEGQAMLARRTGGKVPVRMDELAEFVEETLKTMQRGLLDSARARMVQNSIRNATMEQLVEKIGSDGGFVFGGFCGSADCEQKIKEETKATIRVLPDEEFRSSTPPEKCVCGEKAVAEAVWAKAY
ncbi:MAG: proline--tRNA ligase [Gemmatimonadetes bacterium]|nr:proline--tRNA ligase [Gemmatimonadota bacterium]